MQSNVIDDRQVDKVDDAPKPKADRLREALFSPTNITRELNRRSFYHFLTTFWPEVSNQPFVPNWHIEYLCSELQTVAERVGARLPREYDLIINVPPGSTKTITCSIMFPVWCWTRWYWMRFICASYSLALSLESAEYCRDILRSDTFKRLYPDLVIRSDKDTKGNFKVVKLVDGVRAGYHKRELNGGSRYSTSVGGTLTGFHGDIIIWDDPLNPNESSSETMLATANRWIDETLPTRKTDKSVAATIGIMQRLHQDDPTGHLLHKGKTNIKHICLPGEIINYRHKVQPPELADYYVDNVLDARRLTITVLNDLEKDLGVYGYAGQIGQDPTPPGGGMFKIDRFITVNRMPDDDRVVQTIRFWDKAGSDGSGAYTVGTRISKLKSGRFIIEDVKRGQWAAETRERIIRNTADADGSRVIIGLEQEPGSGGKESVESTIRNLAAFIVKVDKPTGEKTLRADPYAVQVNNGNVLIMQSNWLTEFLEEHRYFPFSRYKDQVDATAGGFNMLAKRKVVTRIT